MFVVIPLIVNVVVICFVGAELLTVVVGKGGADQLLIVSALSGLLTVLSFKLSKEALQTLEREVDAPEGPFQDKG